MAYRLHSLSSLSISWQTNKNIRSIRCRSISGSKYTKVEQVNVHHKRFVSDRICKTNNSLIDVEATHPPSSRS